MHIIPAVNLEEKSKGIINVFINPGEFCFADSHYRIQTLLGSCIAITLWHPRLLIGGMCHIVLPGEVEDYTAKNNKDEFNGRYSEAAMGLFERQAFQHGTQLCEYQAKMFGGGNMFMDSTLKEKDLLGQKNIQAAIKHLSEKQITLQASHVGETGHRWVVFNIESGEVRVKHEPL